MGAGRRMGSTLHGLSTFLVLSSLTLLSDGSPLNVMSASNVLRAGLQENIFVECQDCTGNSEIRVEISIMNFPTKSKRLSSTSVTLTRETNFQGIGQITILADDLSTDPNMKQYVYLQAVFPNQLLEEIVLVSFQPGYIFIQTDKTIYTPRSIVHYRVFAVTPAMGQVEATSSIIETEIVTPDGSILPNDMFSMHSIHSGDYRLPEIATPGLWKVVAKFQNNPGQSYSAEFEVKEYILPSFEVKLMPQSPYFYVDSEEFVVDIKALYRYGEDVDGMAYVVFGITNDGRRTSITNSLQKVKINSGGGVVKLRREQISQIFPAIHDLVGSQLYVAVSVLAENGGEKVEAESRVKIVTSPYIIQFSKTPKYYKPGTAFEVAIEVLNPDGTPAQGVPLLVNPGQVQSKTAADGVARHAINAVATDGLTITAKTDEPLLSNERQASATLTVLPYTSKSNSNINIVIATSRLRVGDDLRAYIHLRKPGTGQNDVTYLIINRGQPIKHGRYQHNSQSLISLMVPITREMLPSFRIIAYYHTDGHEVVADSVLVDVEDSCIGSLKLESSRPAPSYGPHKMFGLKITGDPGATVGLVAVDKSVYSLNNKHRLTQKKVWDLIRKYDTGCTPGGGQDAMGVFYDAGLLFQSIASGTPSRTELKCSTTSRRKRSSSADEDDNSYMEINEVISRSRFPESWLWAYLMLPSCPNGNLNCATTSFMHQVIFPDSITTFQFTGISVSRTHGICVADPLEVIIRKEFFIDLILPYSAVRGEQVEIKAILHNNSPDTMTVRVYLIETADVCSSAFRRGKYQQDVNIGPESTRSVPFIIIPTRIGLHRIEVKAVVKHSMLSDGVVKDLRVKPEGILIKSVKIITLNPAQKGVDGQQEEIINGEIPRQDILQNTPSTTLISVTAATKHDQDRDLTVSVYMPGRSAPSMFKFDKRNYYTTRMSKSETINEDVRVLARGTGEATVTMVSMYYALPREKKSDCQKFNLSVKLLPVVSVENEKIFKLRIDILYQDRDLDATMSILDIGLLTGFTPNTDDLNLLSQGRAHVISKYEMNTVLSDRGSLILYLDKVSHTRPEEITFRIHQKMKVGVLQPAAVSVYEYYDQTPCVKFYHPERIAGQLLQLCRGDECVCAEENCSMQKRGVNNEQRSSQLCDASTDFAYKVSLEEFTSDVSTDIYTVRVLEIFKQGAVDNDSNGKLRGFLSYLHCRESLNLRTGQTYLIMGTSEDISPDGQSYQYVLGGRTWVEYWPTAVECQTDDHREACLALENSLESSQIFGCPQ